MQTNNGPSVGASGVGISPRYSGEFDDAARVDGRLSGAQLRQWAARRAAMLADYLVRRDADHALQLERRPRWTPRTAAAA